MGSEQNPTPSENQVMLRESAERARRLLEQDAELATRRFSTQSRLRLERAGSSIELFAAACELYAERTALAYRTLGTRDFASVTYAELWSQTVRLASGWQREKLVREGDFVAIVGFGGPDFLIAEMASIYSGITAVPLQTNMASAALQAILEETSARCIVCDGDQLAAITALLPRCPQVRSVIAFSATADDRLDARLDQARREAPSSAVCFSSVALLSALGGGPPLPPNSNARAADALRTVVYTSGSTGTPKGAMFPERVYAQKWSPARARAYPFLPDFELPLPVAFIFAPLGHQMGSEQLAASLMRGALTYLAVNGDVSRLFEDFRAARPTFIGLVPRVANQIYEDFTAEVARRAGFSTDAEELARRGQEVMAEMREHHLGDRLLAATSASAPIAPEVLSFLRNCFRIPVYNLMGMTEVGGFTFDGRIRRDNVIDFRLVDVPEKGFSASDQPYPRGELWLCTKRQVSGYFRNEEASHATFDAEGYVHTGDIFEQRAGEEIQFIARKTQVFKLAHGKFVNLSRLEGLFVANSPLIRQAYLYGSSERTFLLAVFVPDLGALPKLESQALSPEGTREVLRREVVRIAKLEGLESYEVPRDFVVELEPFSQANGLVSDNNKPSLAKLKAKYGAALESLYERLEGARMSELRGLAELGPDAPTSAKLCTALRVVLSSTLANEALLASTFNELAGDSLNAVALSALLARECALYVPVPLILDKTLTLETLARTVDAQESARVASVHPGATLHVNELALARLLTPDELASRPRDATPRANQGSSVLLTGANGFLGRFLLLELLSRAESDVERVVCLVRAPNDAAARARLIAGFSSDPELERRFAEHCEGGRLQVIAGDLLRPELGLPRAVSERLCAELDTIFHVGALVNHALSYDALFEPNVLGSVQVMRLALAGRAKTLNFASSVGLAEGLARAPIYEHETACSLWRERSRFETKPGYGYSSSKWASEVLLAELSERHDVRVNVFRYSNIMAHPSYRGQINADDFMCRLLCGLAYTGLAPASFYADPEQPGFFDGLPVDFAAAASVDLAALRRDERHNIYHLALPPRAGAASLDSISEWAREYGLALQRVANYADWYARFREGLNALDAPRKKHSPLGILERWAEPQQSAARLDVAETRAALSLARQSAEFEFPTLDAGFVHKCLDDLARLSLL